MKTSTLIIGAIAAVGVVGILLTALSTLRPKRIERINRNDPVLQAAIDEAKRGLGAFERELATPKEGEGFAVKGKFNTPEGKEYLWVRQPEFQSGFFSGKLDQEPVVLEGKHKGDTVQFKETDAVDWLIKDDNGIRGAFTEKALAGGR